MFKKVHIKNFRVIKELQIDDFKRVNLFVGANNSGKTSVLEALYACSHPKSPFDFLITNSSRGLLRFGSKIGEISEFNYDSLFYYLNPHTPIDFSFESNLVGEVNFQVTPSFQTSIMSSGLESTINGLKVSGLQSNKEFSATYPDENLSASLKPPLFGRVYISPNSLLTEQEYDKVIQADKKAEVLSLLQKLSPTITSYEVLTKSFSFLLKVKDIPKPVPLKAFGDGTNKLFNIACKLYGNDLSKDSVVFIDEIENGLHYTSQYKLWEWLFKVAKDKDIQIFATTHSEDCVRAFVEASREVYKSSAEEEAVLYRLEKKEETIKVVPIEIPVLEVTLSDNGEFR